MAIIEGPSSDLQNTSGIAGSGARPNVFPTPAYTPSNSYGAATSAIARAFRAASDEDAQHTRQNGQSPTKPTNFYMIPRLWMDEFRKYMSLSASAENVDNHPGNIENTLLLLDRNEQSNESSLEDMNGSKYAASASATGIHEDSDDVDEEHERRRKQRRQGWKEVQTEHNRRSTPKGKQPPLLKPNLVHREDYFLVGERAWTLLSCKFGYDVDIPVKSVVISEKMNDDSSTVKMGVEIYPTTTDESSSECVVPIPENGSWNYDSSDNGSEKQNEENDLVSEDEEANLVDLFPSADEPETENQQPAADDNTTDETNQVLLLPPSTTASSTGRQLALVSLDSNASDNTNNNIYPTIDDMEYDNDENNKDPAQPESNTNKRKRYGSGLGNLGNTCFMNSTLQCLAHTGPLRYYFVSGIYEKDLNRDNPLGTGGELATEFADLLSQMWGIGGKESTQNYRSNGNLYSSSRNGNGYYSSGSYSYGSGLSSVVYPRNFKYTLGKHAEQFMGYDQHDSQELATYLLDALHEDTNRITKKPYIEKPEQEDDESDDAAAEKAWELHTKRDDSRVMESFMGQVKSRVQCPVEGCGRVSTTFDPFMYLSVPIPGATDRTMVVTYVPLDPKERMRKLRLTLNKMSTISSLQQKIVESLAGENVEKRLNAEDICLADVWSNEVYSFYKKDDEIDKIRDSDDTYAFELRSVSSIRGEVADEQNENEEDEWDDKHVGLDSQTMSSLNTNDRWMKAIEEYFVRPLTLLNKFNAKRSSHEERMALYVKINKFIQRCHKCPDSVPQPQSPEEPEVSTEEGSEGKSINEDLANSDDSETSDDSLPPIDNEPTLEERCRMSTVFQGVETPHDLAKLEYCCHKYRQFIDKIENEKKNRYKDGAIVQVALKRHTLASSVARMTASVQHHHSMGSDKTFSVPLVVRISPRMTIAEFREMMGVRLSRALKADAAVTKPKASDDGELSDHEEGKELSSDNFEEELFSQDKTNETQPDDGNIDDTASTSCDEANKTNGEHTENAIMNDLPGDENPYNVIMRQIPLTYEKKSTYSYSKSNTASRTLGSVVKKSAIDEDETPRCVYAKPSDDSEQELVAESVGNQGTIYLHWPKGLSEAAFDDNEWEVVDEVPFDEKEASKNGNEKQVSVLDCISKYCQMEQLEDSDKWYCNRCKDFVPAFKQFHLYRTPPILIVHLKRFHFSSTTHRRDKIDSFIDFPLSGLDLTGEVMHWKEGEEPIYDCYAVSNHYGGLGGGHYTAYARGDDGEWCHFDDSRVTTGVNEEEVVSSAAYVLYYRRRDVDSGDFEPVHKILKESESSSIDGQKTSSTELCSSVDAMDVEADNTSGNSSQTCSSPIDSIGEEDLYGDNGNNEDDYFYDGNDDEENPQSQ